MNWAIGLIWSPGVEDGWWYWFVDRTATLVGLPFLIIPSIAEIG